MPSKRLNVRRITGTTFAMLTLALGTTVVAAIPASAAPVVADDTCAPGRVCFYDYDDFTVRLAWRTGGQAEITNLATSIRNKVAGVRNRSDYATALYTEVNGKGRCIEIPPNSMVKLNIFDRDTADSQRTKYGC